MPRPADYMPSRWPAVNEQDVGHEAFVWYKGEWWKVFVEEFDDEGNVLLVFPDHSMYWASKREVWVP